MTSHCSAVNIMHWTLYVYSCDREMTDLNMNLFVIQARHLINMLFCPLFNQQAGDRSCQNEAATGASRVQAAPCGENELRLDPTPSALHMQCATTCIIKHRKAQTQHSLWPMAAEGGPCKLSRASHSEFVCAACCFSLFAITRGCFIYLTKEQMLWSNAFNWDESFQSLHLVTWETNVIKRSRMLLFG